MFTVLTMYATNCLYLVPLPVQPGTVLVALFLTLKILDNNYHKKIALKYPVVCNLTAMIRVALLTSLQLYN